MINKKEFDLLLQVIFQIENKIVEVKILNQFDKAREYETKLEIIRLKAKDIVLDEENKIQGFDDLSLNVFAELIQLHSDLDYYILKSNNIIESSVDSKIDAEILKKIKQQWDYLGKDIEHWKESNHNPIEEIEFNKHIGKITLENIIYQLQAEGILDYSKVFNYCRREYLINAVKEVLFEGAKEEFHDEIRRHKLINLAKNLSEKDIYSYKLWEQVLMIKNVRSRYDHIEIIGSFQEKDSKKSITNEESKNINEKNFEKEQNLEVYYDESILKSIKNFFIHLSESTNQKKMNFTWTTSKGPAFRAEFEDGDIRYAKEYLDKSSVESVKRLTIASNGVSKYNFEKDSKWEKLEELEFLNEKNTSNIDLSPDKTYNFIGNETFANCKNLKNISFGKIEMIGEKAFRNCTSLSDITFSESVINIGEDAFLDCNNINKVTFLGNLKLYILERPQNIINCFKGTNLEQIVFPDIETAFNFAITDCPKLKNIVVSNISNISIPFKTCKYRLGREEGIVSFVGEKALNLWKKRSTTIRFFELTDEEKKKIM